MVSMTEVRAANLLPQPFFIIHFLFEISRREKGVPDCRGSAGVGGVGWLAWK